MDSSVGSNDTIQDAVKKYARRARHKTRTTKYEYGAGIDKRKTQSARAITTRKRQNSGAILNENFRAANVNTAGVTLKHTSPPGMFGKNAFFPPLHGRDLPDLTFMRMSFLSGSADGDASEYTRG